MIRYPLPECGHKRPNLAEWPRLATFYVLGHLPSLLAHGIRPWFSVSPSLAVVDVQVHQDLSHPTWMLVVRGSYVGLSTVDMYGVQRGDDFDWL